MTKEELIIGFFEKGYCCDLDEVKNTCLGLLEENQKYKEVNDKIKTNIENDIDGFRTINEFGENNEILELLDIYLDILKEVE